MNAKIQSDINPAVEHFPRELMNPDEAAVFLRASIGQGSAKTLAKLRTIGGGPIFRKVGTRRVMYAKRDLITWANAKVGNPLSSTSAA